MKAIITVQGFTRHLQATYTQMDELENMTKILDILHFDFTIEFVREQS